MLVACVSDIHGNLPALAAVLASIDPSIDVVFAGDICGYYPEVDECVRQLSTRRVHAIRGNHDQVLIQCVEDSTLPGRDYEERFGTAVRRTIPHLSEESRAWLRALPIAKTIEMGGRTITIVHGAPWDPLEGRVYPDFNEWPRFASVDADVVVLGQTHYALTMNVDGKLIVNPGSVGQARDIRGLACFGFLDTDDMSFRHQRVVYDPTMVIAAAQSADPGIPYLAEVLTRRPQ
jgi:putative phosphoesterase